MALKGISDKQKVASDVKDILRALTVQSSRLNTVEEAQANLERRLAGITSGPSDLVTVQVAPYRQLQEDYRDVRRTMRLISKLDNLDLIRILANDVLNRLHDFQDVLAQRKG